MSLHYEKDELIDVIEHGRMGPLINGTVEESFDARVTSDGVTVTMSLEKTGGGNLTKLFSSGISILDCTPALTIALTAGSDSSPQVNYVYILESDGILTLSTSGWPSTEHIRIGFFFVRSAVGAQSSGGALINQNWNDYLADTNNQGHLAHIAERMRVNSSQWFSGVDGNGTTNYLTITAGNVELIMTSGVVYQIHAQAFPGFDTSGGDEVHVKNWSGDSYHSLTNLHDITEDSGGNSIGNNKYFNLVIWGVANKTGEHEAVLINLPSGFYNTQSNAENDVMGHDDFTIPREFAIDSSTGFLIARITIRMGATWTHVSTVDLRGTSPQSASGGAAGIATEFADNTFAVFDNLDNTKVINLDAASITTGNTRVLTMKDGDLDLGEVVRGDTGIVQDNAVQRADGSGLSLQTSLMLIDDAGLVTGVKLADAVVDSGNITQHEGDIDHDALANLEADEHHLVDFGMSTSDQSLANDATLNDITDLAVSIVAGGVYQIEGSIGITCASTTPNCRIALTFPSMSTFLVTVLKITDTTLEDGDFLTASGTPTNNMTMNAGDQLVFHLKGSCVATASGTLQVRFRQNTSDATAIIAKAGSFIKVERIA